MAFDSMKVAAAAWFVDAADNSFCCPNQMPADSGSIRWAGICFHFKKQHVATWSKKCQTQFKPLMV
ncbi:hypothetical protein [Klebsiella pneumoniae]|uniref:hypothetical protein n=1 Tax=Klebsiella pneumoniae TaxID=573 RepID=UPI00388F701C